MVESSLYLGTATQMVVRLADDTRMTVLVPNADEAARQRLPAAGDARAAGLVGTSTCTWSGSRLVAQRRRARRCRTPRKRS